MMNGNVCNTSVTCHLYYVVGAVPKDNLLLYDFFGACRFGIPNQANNVLIYDFISFCTITNKSSMTPSFYQTTQFYLHVFCIVRTFVEVKVTFFFFAILQHIM